MIEHDIEPSEDHQRTAYFASCRSIRELMQSGLTTPQQIALGLFLAELLTRPTR